MRKMGCLRQILSQASLALVGFFVVAPIWGIVYLAFDGGVKGWPMTFRFWPEQPTLDMFIQVWNRTSQFLSFPALLLNSLFVSLGAALLSVGLGASMAYAFARYRFPGRKAGLLGLLVGALLPPVALMTPLYMLLTMLGLRTSLWGLMIVYTSFSMPFCIWNMRSAFQAVSVELEEAAFLDGANALTSFLWVTLPLALPSIAVAALIAFLIGYSEFAMGWLFVEKAQNVTLAMAIAGTLQGGVMESWSKLAALAVMMSLPVVLIFLFLQRFLLDRLLFSTTGTE